MVAIKAIQAWIKSHRCQTTLYVMSGIIVIAPEVATTPLFFALGLEADGPRPGTYRTFLITEVATM